MYIEIEEHGLMMTDYFHGTDGVWINIYVNQNSTVKNIIDNLESEINILYDHIQYVAQNHSTSFYDDSLLDNMINEEIQKLKEENTDRMEEKPFKNNEFSDDEDDENPMLIITIEFIKK